jgi:hypothetical protein
MFLACAGTDPLDPGAAPGITGGPNAGGVGGRTGVAGADSGSPGLAGSGTSAAGNAGLGGAASGQSGHGGLGGLGGAPSGVAGLGGAGAGRGGKSAGGRGGAAAIGGGAGVAAASAGAASTDLPPVAGATFTDVYTKVFSQYCFGSGCHNPSGGNRPDFSTQAGTYSYFKRQGQLYGGQDPQKSYIYFVMHGNPSSSPPTPPYMPPTPNPKVSPEALAIVAGWIADGATND